MARRRRRRKLSALKPPHGVPIRMWNKLPLNMQREYIRSTAHILTWIDDYKKA